MTLSLFDHEYCANVDERFYSMSNSCKIYCLFCGTSISEGVSFCLCCGRTIVPHGGQMHGIGYSARRSQGSSLTAASFKVSRRCFNTQRKIRRALISAWTSALLLVPYYAGCKVIMGDSFPANIVVTTGQLIVRSDAVLQAVFN